MPFDTAQSAYTSLRNIISERTSGVVFWTGSGLSAEAGLPTWGQLRSGLMEALTEQMRHIEQPQRDSLLRKADAIRKEQSNWKAFRLLKDTLGDATWRALVRERLVASASTNAPPLYARLWQLAPHGLLTLNLDRLATKSYMDTHQGSVLTEFVGNQTASYTHVLKSPHPFVCQLHGNADDSSSWILTSSDLSYRLSDAGYRNFITTCLSAKTIVFVGISADDIAVGGFLDQLSGFNIDTGTHYWLTPPARFPNQSMG